MTTWHDVIGEEKEKEYFLAVRSFEQSERNHHKVFPAAENVFKALELTPFDNVKVVILGQDPYHGVGQAHGMSFSVKKGVKIPPSLQNIYKELQSDLGIEPADNGFLESWAEQGVLLLNTSFSVEKGKPASHANFGWMEFSEHVLDFLNDCERPLVFILWGAHAQKVGARITNPKHLKIESAHPSPFSARRGFFGSKPFSKANKFLEQNGETPIDWRVQ